MRAIQLEQFGIDHLKLVDIPTPHIGENEVLVKTSTVSLQYLDLIMVEGNIIPDLKFPHIPVSEGMGVVEQIGRNVTRWKKGDRVLIFLTKNLHPYLLQALPLGQIWFHKQTLKRVKQF